MKTEIKSFEREYYENFGFWESNNFIDHANQMRISETAKLVPTDIKTLADIGCGNGVFLHYLQNFRKDLKLVGVDRSEAALTFVNVEKFHSDITNLPFEDNSFDCVSCLEVIEHLPVPLYNMALKELTRISKKYLVISVPYNESLERGYSKCPQCTSLFNRDLHLRRFDKYSMKVLLENYGYTSQDILTLGEIEEYWLHETYTSIFYRKNKNVWSSPICPICGYSEEKLFSPYTQKISKPTWRNWLPYITRIPKSIWPTKKRDYWIMALYIKH
jgi:ubiquinone/menaquinone biosynthesis C-methylase UbiE